MRSRVCVSAIAVSKVVNFKDRSTVLGGSIHNFARRAAAPLGGEHRDGGISRADPREALLRGTLAMLALNCQRVITGG